MHAGTASDISAISDITEFYTDSYNSDSESYDSSSYSSSSASGGHASPNDSLAVAVRWSPGVKQHSSGSAGNVFQLLLDSSGSLTHARATTFAGVYSTRNA